MMGPFSPLRAIIALVGLVAIAAGAALAAFGVTGALAHKQAASGGNAYMESGTCTGCPSGVSLDSVEVQSRSGSTLFIVRGKWPASVDGLSQSVRLVANDTEIVLKPHGSQNVFEITRAVRAGAQLPATSVGGSIQGDALLIDVTPAFGAPVALEIGLWDGSEYKGRIPRSGRLAWSGSGAPRSPATAGGSPSPLAPGDAITLPASCDAIPNNVGIPPFLQPGAVSSSAPTSDPRTHAPTRSITVALGGSALSTTTPYAIVGVINHSGQSGATGQARAIDGAGAEQLIVSSDGSAKHKTVRKFSQGAWTVVQDANAGSLTTDLSATSFSFFWTELQQGDHFGFITATTGACRTAGLDSQLQPQQVAN